MGLASHTKQCSLLDTLRLRRKLASQEQERRSMLVVHPLRYNKR